MKVEIDINFVKNKCVLHTKIIHYILSHILIKSYI
jgi:hypothetical protein